MEPIMQFLENYWGYTLFSGVSVGTLVTFIVVQIKTLSAGRLKDTRLGVAVDRIEQLSNKYEQTEEEKTDLAVRNAYLEKVVATMFKSVSYIVVASKLPTEDKLALESEFIRLMEEAKSSGLTVVTAAKTKLVETAKDVFDQEKGTVASIIATTVDQTKTLLDKYTNKGDV